MKAFLLVVNMIVGLCVSTLFIVILINFMEAQESEKVKQEKKSIVETGTMTLFFLLFYYLLRQRLLVPTLASQTLRVTLAIIGLGILIFGCIVNIMGRLRLGKNWANQIRIYTDHTMVSSGVYRLVRHPLYASLIWMYYGASLVYLNCSAFLANTLIFIPFMYYRARQEELLLTERFPEYSAYRAETGMFFPRLIKRRAKNEGM